MNANFTYRHFCQLLLYLVQFVLLTGGGEQSRGISALHSIHLDGRLQWNIGECCKLEQQVGSTLREHRPYKYSSDKLYLNQLCCRSDNRRAELSGLKRENLHEFDSEEPDVLTRAIPQTVRTPSCLANPLAVIQVQRLMRFLNIFSCTSWSQRGRYM